MHNRYGTWNKTKRTYWGILHLIVAEKHEIGRDELN